MAARSRTSRACESCRLLKIRCISAEDPNVLQCENCEKSGKDCIFVPRSGTRRRKRTDARVTDLEREVRALASLLRQSEDGNRTHGRYIERPETVHKPDDDLLPSTSVPGMASRRMLNSAPSPSLRSSNLASSSSFYNRIVYESTPSSSFLTSLTTPEQLENSQSGQPQFIARNTSSPTDTRQRDVIDRGLLSWNDALQLFRRYQQQLVHCYPIVPLADTTDPESFRRQKPVLFLAAITAAAAVSSEHLRDALHNEILGTYANCVMVKGVKNLELLQAMLITVAWYRPCGSYNDTKYLQYSQAASLMAHELGLGKPTKKVVMRYTGWSGSNTGLATSQTGDKSWNENQTLDTEDIESHRTLLASYVQSSRCVNSC